MCSCITPQALLSGLVLRIEREGYHPAPADVASILGSGCPREHVLAAIDRLQGVAREQLRSAFEAALAGR